jgi:hypothetical protein
MENDKGKDDVASTLAEIKAGVEILAWFLGVLIVIAGIALYHFW